MNEKGTTGTAGRECLACGKAMDRRAKTDTCASCRSTHATVMAEQRRRDVRARESRRATARRLKDLEAQRIEELRWIDAHGASDESTKRLNTIHYHIHIVRKDAKGAK